MMLPAILNNQANNANVQLQLEHMVELKAAYFVQLC
jgi:hypothetical protein